MYKPKIRHQTQLPPPPPPPGFLPQAVQQLVNRLIGAGGPQNEQLAQDLICAEGEAAIAAARRQRLKDDARINRLNAEAALRRREHQEAAYYRLREAMKGKKIDSTWTAYATNIVRDYLDSANVLHPRFRVEEIDGAIDDYVNTRKIFWCSKRTTGAIVAPKKLRIELRTFGDSNTPN